MLNMYKRLSLIVTLLFACSWLGGIAFAQTFSDIQGNWAQKQIEEWASKGLVAGYPDGTFRPDNRVTRAEFVTMVNHAFVADKKEATNNYKDVQSTQWYYHEVAIAKQQGYIAGYPDGTFKPGNFITNQEVAQILAKLFITNPQNLKDVTYTDKDQIGSWAYDAVKEVTSYHIMNGYTDGTFKPNHDITRAETLVALDNTFLVMSAAQPTGSTTSNPLPLPLPLPIQLPVPIQLPDPGQLPIPPIQLPVPPTQLPIPPIQLPVPPTQLPIPLPPVQLPGPVPQLPLPLDTGSGISNISTTVSDTVSNTTNTLTQTILGSSDPTSSIGSTLTTTGNSLIP